MNGIAAIKRDRAGDTRRVRAAFEASRLNAFSFDPADLVLIEDPKHPLYDARVNLPLKPEFVANVKAIGVVEPVIIRKIDGDPVVIDGRQRVRAARAINEEAGECLIKVPAMVRTGDEADAYTITVSLNEQRQDDPRREKIVKAQRLAQLGRSAGDIALAMGVSVPTVKRMLGATAKDTGPRKTRGKGVALTKGALRQIIKDGAPGLTERESLLLLFALDGPRVPGFAEEFPALARAVSP